MLLSSLPIYDVLPDLTRAMDIKSNILLEAPPGAGKTTIVPLAMLHRHYLMLSKRERIGGGGITSSDQHDAADYQIWVVEPRRVAARSAATRMAALLGESVGTGTVGYMIRGESRVAPGTTQITVVTDGILLQRLRSDPELTGIDLVIFDEFHERGVDSDVALALCRETQRVLRSLKDSKSENDNNNNNNMRNPPLQIIVMSATLLGDLDTSGETNTDCQSPVTKLMQSLGDTDNCEVLKSDGRQYPITINHANKIQWNRARPLPLRVLQRDRKELVNVMCDAIQQGVLRAPAKGDVLAFLPGAAEIIRTIRQLAEQNDLPKDVEVVPLYGALPKEQQDYALFPEKSSRRRRVIVSSPISEASLTLERVTCVVDSGLRREPRCDVDTNMPRLVTTLCSKASATQRAGRAGRVQEGLCLRIYTESELEESFKDQSDPEILSTDLSPTVLLLADWGCSSRHEILEEIPFVDRPPVESLNSAIRLLVELDALKETDKRLAITPQGRLIAQIPSHPRFATAIEEARKQQNPVSLAAAIAITFLLDDDAGIRSSTNTPDLGSRVFDLYSESSETNDRRSSNVAKALLRYASRIGKDAKSAVQDVLDDKIRISEVRMEVGTALLPGFTDLIGERKGDASYGGSTYLLSLGRSARLDDYNQQGTNSVPPDYVVVADTTTGDDGKTRVRAFASIDKARLLERSFEREVVFTVPSRGHEVRARRARMIGSLELESTPLPSPPVDKVVEILKETIQKLGGYSAALSSTLGPEKQAQVQDLRQRVRLASKLTTNEATEWPACFSALDKEIQGDDEERILEHIVDPWLAVSASLKKIDLFEILMSSLTPEQQKQLDRDFPLSIQAPDGSNIPVNYSTDPPSASAKLQQFFGTSQSPTVGPDHNPIPLSLSLLSPGGKVVAQTIHLPFFWTEAYPQVRAELRGRYAKHPWPEDPMTAVATRQTKKQLSLNADTKQDTGSNSGSKKKRGNKRR